MQEIKDSLKQAIKNLYNLDFDPEITPSPENIDADYSSNAPLKLTKELHKPPMQIAEELSTQINNQEGDFCQHSADAHSQNHNGHGRGVGTEIPSRARLNRCDFDDGESRTLAKIPLRLSKNISAPGFINFTLPDNYLMSSIANLNENFEHEIVSDKFAGKTVICEFSDPNPFKVLHVGHLYTSIVGDSISRLFEYAGAEVIRANFGGDVGLHVAKTMYILQQKSIKNLTIEDIAECYVEGTNAYENDEAAKQEITKLNKEIYKINAEGITRTGDANRGTPKMFAKGKILGDNSRQDPSGNNLADLYWKGRELSYEYFENFYASIGLKFDKYYPESTVAALGLKTVKEQLEKGVYEISDGAVIFNGEKFGLHTRVFINKEGIPTYEAKDVGLIFAKWDDYHFDKSVVITANEQLEYMKVVLKSIEQYAPDLVKKTSHLTHGVVKLPGNVKMSSRKGNFIKAVDVVDMVKTELKTAYDSDDEKVSLAAMKYAFLKYKMGSDIIFDPKESVKMTGNSGPYLLYSVVRAKKILARSATSAGDAFLARTPGGAPATTGEDAAAGPAERELQMSERSLMKKILDYKNVLAEAEKVGPEKDMSDRTPAERNLMKKILEYKGVLEEAVTEMAPHKVANYLYDLAQDFSRFYETCQVTGSAEETERIKLVKVYLDTMAHGLDILGITIPEEM